MESKIITRIRHGITKREHSEEYLEFLIKTGVEDYEKAKYYDEGANYLLEFESNVIHCETFEF
jgi:hypothetical protein